MLSSFQSTLPVWGATVRQHNFLFCHIYFNPRSPCGERRSLLQDYHRGGNYFNPRSPCGERRFQITKRCWHYSISIHAPRVGSDIFRFFSSIYGIIFQSTLPVWGATLANLVRHSNDIQFQSTLPVWGATAKLTNKNK